MFSKINYPSKQPSVFLLCGSTFTKCFGRKIPDYINEGYSSKRGHKVFTKSVVALTHPRWHRSKLYAPCLTEKLKESEIHLWINHLYPDPASEKAATGIWEKADSWQLWCLELSEITGNIPKGFPRWVLTHEVRLSRVSNANNLWLQRNFSPWNSVTNSIHPLDSSIPQSMLLLSKCHHHPVRDKPCARRMIPNHTAHNSLLWTCLLDEMGTVSEQETSQPRR